MTVTNPNNSPAPSVAFTLDFQQRPPWRSIYVDQPHFAGSPLPSAYQGKTVDELLRNAPRVVDTLSAPDVTPLNSLNLLSMDSPELRTHPILEKFVQDMGGDPLALVNYVLNEIELTDAMSYSESGNVSEVAINPGGVNRGALATLLEGQGSPAEQCALTVYLLRRAGVKCGYVFGTTNGLAMFDQQLSKLLRMQIRGAANQNGDSNVPYLIPTNYPWVAAYIDNRWVHIFPWLKDTSIEEGQDIYPYLPVGYNTGRRWLDKYLKMDLSIRNEGKNASGAFEYDNPGYLFPAYVKKCLKDTYPGTTIDQLGVSIYNRKNWFTRWEDLPRPWQTPAVSNTDLKESLTAIASIFDTVSLQVYSDRNGNGQYDNGEPMLQTGALRTVDLHNRRLLLYATQVGTTTAHTLNLVLEPFRPAATGTGSFAAGDLLSRQVLSTGLQASVTPTLNDDGLQFKITYDRHRKVARNLSATDHWTPFLGFSEALQIVDQRPLRKGDMAAVVFNYGRVTPSMVQVHVKKYQAIQERQQQPSPPALSIEDSAGLPACLMGLSYYANVSQSQQALFALTKTHVISMFAHGFSKLGAARTVGGLLPNNGQISLIYPKVDMSFQRVAWANNGTLHANSGQEDGPPTGDWLAIFNAEISAQEHRTINQFFQQTDAVSTVKLLDATQTGWTDRSMNVEITANMNAGSSAFSFTGYIFDLTVGTRVLSSNLPGGSAAVTYSSWSFATNVTNVVISQSFVASKTDKLVFETSTMRQVATYPATSIVQIDKGNYQKDINGTPNPNSPWNTNYTRTENGASKTKSLAAWAGFDITNPNRPSLYKTIVDGFQQWDADYRKVYMTPGPVSGALGYYQGMGAYVDGLDENAALITDSINTSNGGYGPPLSGLSLSSGGTFYFSESGAASFQSNNDSQYLKPSMVVSGAGITYNNLSIGTTVFSDPTKNILQTSAYATGSTYNFTLGPDRAAAFQDFQNSGQSVFTLTGQPTSYNSNSFNFASDPVNIMTGAFYIDAIDLRLNGPMPLDIRRNYSSQALGDSMFGYGWRLAYVPYLVPSDNESVIYAAEMDGSILAYEQQASPNTRWIPTVAKNSQLSNSTGSAAGSVTNLFNNRIDKTTVTTGGVTDTFYTLTGADGSTRKFKKRSFATGATNGGTNGLTRERPYLQEWRDNRGNFYTFTYGEDNTTVEWGQLVRVTSSNGNYASFQYDAYGHIVEAFTGDGRRLFYKYDEYGDLIRVTLPDGTNIGYEYSHKENTAPPPQSPTGTPNGFYSTHLIVRENKPGGRVLENVYDDATKRRVVEQKATVGPNFTLVTNGRFTYENNFTADPATAAPLTGDTIVKDANNRITRYDYVNGQITLTTDPLNQTVAQEWYASTDGAGGYQRSLKKSTDKRGLVLEFEYDSRGNLVKKKETGNLTGDAAGEVALTTSTYNALNMVTETKDPAGNITKILYENVSYPYLPTSLESWAPGGTSQIATTQFTYENVIGGGLAAYGVLQKVKKAVGTSDEAVTTYTNNASGFVTQISRPTGTADPTINVFYTYNLRGELTSEMDAAGRTTSYAYDGRGNRIWTERRDEKGTLVAWQYDYFNQNGELEWSDGPRFDPEDYVLHRYDGAGRPSEELRWRTQARQDGSGVEAVPGLDEAYASTFYSHDLFGNLTEVRDPRHNSTKMDYDGIGQMLSRVRYDGYALNGGVAGAELSRESFLYEPGGEVKQYTNPLGGITKKYYTDRGQLKRQENPDNTVLEWRFDLAGRPVKETLSNGNFWTTAYDFWAPPGGGVAPKITRTFSSPTVSNLATNLQLFDRRGNVVSKTDEENNLFTTIYDDLDRVKTTTGPAASGTSARQTVTHTYDAAGINHVVTDGLGNQTVTTVDAEGRTVLTKVVSPGGQIVRQSSAVYTPDHHSVTTTSGTGAGRIQESVWTDTAGRTVLEKHGDQKYRFSDYDAAGNLELTNDELRRSTVRTYDALNRLKTLALPAATAGAEATTTFLYDKAGNLLQRQMPGTQTQVMTYDNAGRKLTEELQGAQELTSGITLSETGRQFTYTYYPAGANVGRLQTVTDGRGVVKTMVYDDFLRPQTVTAAGSADEQGQSVTYGYDRLSRPLTAATAYTVPSTGPPTLVERTYDGYGQVSREEVSVDGTLVSDFRQTWDAAGRRTNLASQLAALGGGAGRSTDFGYRADGLLTQVGASGNVYNFSYGDQGLLTTRSGGGRTQSVTSRDALGRLLGQSLTVGAGTPLAETLGWDDASRRSTYAAARTGGGMWNDSRVYNYNQRGQLFYETNAPASGATGNFLYRFDFESLSVVPAGSGLGVRTAAMWRLGSDGETFQPGSWLTYDPEIFGGGWRGVDAFSRPTNEAQFLAPNNGSQVLMSYDGVGQTTWRGYWTAGATPQERQQTLTWDGFGNLIAVLDGDMSWSDGYVWKAIYDGLGRRLRTTWQAISGGSPTGPIRTIASQFDPKVEFLEVSVAVDGVRTWELHGPDLAGGYGSQQGIGGLEATIDESAGTVNTAINDTFGNVVGHVAGGVMVWHPAQAGSYGVLPGSSALPLDGTSNVSETLVWRSRRLDPTGFYWMGARYYEPNTGRFLSADPLGHGSSMGLYDYANGDPVNGLDPDGRTGVTSGRRDDIEDLGEISAPLPQPITSFRQLASMPLSPTVASSYLASQGRAPLTAATWTEQAKASHLYSEGDNAQQHADSSNIFQARLSLWNDYASPAAKNQFRVVDALNDIVSMTTIPFDVATIVTPGLVKNVLRLNTVKVPSAGTLEGTRGKVIREPRDRR